MSFPAAIKTLTISGAHIKDITSFYDEINRVFMSEVDWRLGESLDGLDDMLRGGYGAIAGREAVRVVWQDMDVARAALGLDATRDYLRAKLKRPDVYNVTLIERQLAELESERGLTYFEIVLQIIADHPNIELIAA